jgi:hypothetical protein
VLLAVTAVGVLATLWRGRHAPRRESRRTRRVRATDAVAADVASDVRANTPAAAHTATHAAADTGSTAPSDTQADVQSAADGAGHMMHRRYDIVLPGTQHTCDSLLRTIQQNFAELSPSALADFEKTHGSPWQMRVDDEYTITMLGPWNGAVRVRACDAQAFTLVTLDGHPEAGHITFSVAPDNAVPDALRVRIESWARSRDALVDVAYATLGIGKQVQTEVWVTFLQRVSALAGLADAPEVQITSETLTGPVPAPGVDV